MLVHDPPIGANTRRLSSLLALALLLVLGPACDQNLTGGAAPAVTDLGIPLSAPLDLLPPGSCDSDEACGSSTPRCDPGSHRCVACLPERDNCAAGQRCLLRRGAYTCTSGCDVDSDCARPDAGGMVACCAGACVDLAADRVNCGGCGLACGAVEGGSSECRSGACVVGSCDAGRLDCDHRSDNGCEVVAERDDAHCGACGNACTREHGDAHCAAARCTLTACHDGYADCDGNEGNGCEVHTDSDADHCGACDHVCAGAGSTQSCSQGTCHVDRCDQGLADCNGLASDGCEIDVQADTKNCGGCGKACVTANGEAACTGGACIVRSCRPGFADCNGLQLDGCETNLGSPANCGACGKACVGPNNVAVSCSGGACVVGGCLPGFADCDGNPGNGCEPRPCASCRNSKKDGDESDVDCGGSLCAPCQAGQGCQVNADCASQSCEPVCCQVGFVCDQNGCRPICEKACNTCNP